MKNSAAHRQQTFAQVLDNVESSLVAYYELANPPLASTFLLGEEALAEPTAAKLCGPTTRAAVWVQEGCASEELFVGLFFSNDLQTQLCQVRPEAGLSLANLDAYCVLVEELSHFHLLLQRAEQNRQVSQLELEWQGEVDKFLLAALLLQEQVGKTHVHALQQLIFEQCSITAEEGETERYHEASKQAARFWQQAIAQGIGADIPLTQSDFRQLMQANFHRPLQEKSVFKPKILAKK